MKAPIKITIFALAIAAVFVIAYFAGSLLVPEEIVNSWKTGTTDH